jgi:hypothetical protein
VSPTTHLERKTRHVKIESFHFMSLLMWSFCVSLFTSPFV